MVYRYRMLASLPGLPLCSGLIRICRILLPAVALGSLSHGLPAGAATAMAAATPAPERCDRLFERLHRSLAEELTPAVRELVDKLKKEIELSEGKGAMSYEISQARRLLEELERRPTRELFRQIEQTGKALAWKRSFREQLAAAINSGKKVVFTGLGQWKYILALQGTQLTAEAIANWDDLESSNPILIARQLLSDPETIQNMAYMGTETFLMSGVSAPTDGHQRSWREIGKAFRNCAIIAFVNSNIMNLGIKGEADFGRVALDTSWEMILGNAQTQLDLGILATFERMAVRYGQSRLKLVGYALVMAEQGVGYYAYSRAAGAYEDWRRGSAPVGGTPVPQPGRPVRPEDLRLVPIFAPEEQPQGLGPVAPPG